jgi:orotidine-5'-phosphate decarboxylase
MLAGLAPGESPRMTGYIDRVSEIARLAADASLDGVVTSPNQISRMRTICGRRFIIVTSGLGTCDGINSDHARAVGAADAIRAGADYVVIGGPIWRATEPARAVREITDAIERGLRANPRNAIEVLNPRPV